MSCLQPPKARGRFCKNCLSSSAGLSLLNPTAARLGTHRFLQFRSATNRSQWSLTTLREKLVKIGAKVVRQSKYVTFHLAEVAVPRQLFAAILELIGRLAMRLAVCRSGQEARLSRIQSGLWRERRGMYGLGARNHARAPLRSGCRAPGSPEVVQPGQEIGKPTGRRGGGLLTSRDCRRSKRIRAAPIWKIQGNRKSKPP
jgi:hypothetical protein